MKSSILDDYHDTLRTLDCFTKLSGHDVEVWNDHVQDVQDVESSTYCSASPVTSSSGPPIEPAGDDSGRPE